MIIGEPNPLQRLYLRHAERSEIFQRIGRIKHRYFRLRGGETYFRGKLAKGPTAYTTRPPTMVRTDSMERI